MADTTTTNEADKAPETTSVTISPERLAAVEAIEKQQAEAKKAGELNSWLLSTRQRTMPVFAVGATVEDAVTALAAHPMLKLGKVQTLDSLPARPADVEAEKDSWVAMFSAGKTAYQCGGYNVAGGVVITWWR